MENNFAGAAIYLIRTVFTLYTGAVMLRFILQIVRADFYNPLSQFLVKVTNPTLVPLRRIIPSIGKIDTATIVLLLALQMLGLFLIFLAAGQHVQLPNLFVLSIAELLYLLLNIYIFTILVQIILSWIGPGTSNPITSLLYYINEPVLGRARRIIPPISGIDISPVFVFMAIQLIKMLIVDPIDQLGRGPLFG